MKRAFELLFVAVLLLLIFSAARNRLAVFYSNQGYEYYSQGLYDKAIDSFKKSIKVDSSAHYVHYNLAKAYEMSGMADKAIDEHMDAIELDKSFAWSYESLADLYFRRGMYEEALSVLEEAEKNISDTNAVNSLSASVSCEYASYLINKAMDDYSKGSKEAAYKQLEKAVRMEPGFSPGYYTLGYFYYADGRYDKAIEFLKKTVEIKKDSFEAYKLLGDIYFEKRIFHKAINEYTEALSINRNDASLLNNLGLSYMNIEEYEKAIHFAAKAAKTEPENIHFIYSLASLYRDAGRLKDSAQEYEKLISARPDYPNAHNDLAGVYERQGLKEKALEEYEKELELCKIRLKNNPGSAHALNSIARAYNGIGDYVNAKFYAQKAVDAEPDYREAYITMANIQNNLKDFKGSMETLKKAKRLSGQELSFIDQAMDNVKELYFFPTDVVYLKNGRHFEGVIKKETEDAVILEMDIGSSRGTVTLPRDNIDRIVSK